jgi:hypothetical protein
LNFLKLYSIFGYFFGGIRCNLLDKWRTTYDNLFLRPKWSLYEPRIVSSKCGTTMRDFPAFRMTITWEGDFNFFFSTLGFFFFHFWLVFSPVCLSFSLVAVL